MFKNRNITDFFKPFANPRPAKRAKYGGEDEQVKENNTPVAESSSSARIAVRAKHNPTDARPSLDELTTSSLSSLQSDDSTFYIPDKIPQDIVAQDTLSSTTFPLVASSQRVSRNGEFMIRNSDDDTDSEISLEDIRDILIGKKPTVRSSPPIEPDLPPQPTANRVRPSRQTEISRFSRVSTTLPPTTKYKFSLAALVAKAEQDDATDEGTAQARQLIESLEDRRAALEAKIDQDLGIENPVGGLLASVAEKYGDGDTLGKLMQAIERTEALSMQNCWSFFESTTSESLEAESNSPKDFPRIVSSLLPHNLSTFYISCANGYLGEVAARGKLPKELLHWILDAASTEFTEDLRRAYVSTLSHAGAQAMSNFGPLSIDMLLRPLGAKNDALNVESPIEPVRRIPFQDDELRAKALSTSGLRNVLKLLTSVSGWMYSESRAHSLCILCRVLVDTCVTKDRSTLEAAEDAFECLVSSIPEIQLEAESLIILSSAFSQLKDAQLRLQLLRCIPATTLRLSLLRRRLSLAFFYENSNYLTKQPPDLISIRDIIAQLRKPEYSIGINTDYVQLAANIAILDIGLDDGDPPDFAVDLDPDTIFNGKVDKLAEVVKDILSKIADAGASFMTRTEAKDGLEAFYNRIVYAVRTKPRPKNSHFGTSNISAGDVMSNGGFMSNFLSNRKLAVDIKDVLHNETSSEKASD